MGWLFAVDAQGAVPRAPEEVEGQATRCLLLSSDGPRLRLETCRQCLQVAWGLAVMSPRQTKKKIMMVDDETRLKASRSTTRGIG
jgi:hypothetical protein